MSQARDDFFHWADVFDYFDEVFARADRSVERDVHHLHIYDPQEYTPLVLEVLRVSAMLLELRVSNSKNISMYNSLDHLYKMLASDNLDIVTGALEVLLALGRHRNKPDPALETYRCFYLYVTS